MFNTLQDCINYRQQYHLTKDYPYYRDNLSFFNAYSIHELKRHHIRKYVSLRQKKVKNATINRELSFARASINCVNYDFEIDIHNPFSKFKLVEDDYIANYLTKDEFQKLLKHSLDYENNNLHDFILLLCMTGCRPIELLTLTSDNVFLEKRQFIVRNHFSKSRKTMYKYLNDTALEIITPRTRTNLPIFINPRTGKAYKSFSKSFARCKERAGIDCTMYDLRHTFASWLVQNDVEIYTIKDLLGHGDIESTMRYAHLNYKKRVDTISILDNF